MTPTEQPEWWDQWTYFDKKDMETKLKPDAPEEVQQEWEQLNQEGNYLQGG